MPSTFIGDTELEWFYEPDPEAVAQQIFKAADELANTTRPMTIARDLLIADMRQKFAQEHGAEAKWQPWAPSYAPYAQRTNEGILDRYGKMLRTLTFKNAWRVTRSQIFLSLANTPKTKEGYPIALLHETGTESGTARRLKAKLGRLESQTQQMAAGQRFVITGGLTSEEFDQLKAHTGRGKNLPRRELIEPTERAKEAVYQVFVQWFEGGIRTASGKFIPGVVRGPGGHFTAMRG